jgi:hypothetical protein
MTPDEITRVRDIIESEVLLDEDMEIIFAEGAWVCGCPDDTESQSWVVPDAEHPLKFGFCIDCHAAALVTVWGS